MGDTVKLASSQFDDLKNSAHDIRNLTSQINRSIDGKVMTALKDVKGISEQLSAINETNRAGFTSMVEAIAKLQPPEPSPAPFKPLIFARITDIETGTTIEGDLNKMILKNTQQARVTAKFKSRLGGPAMIQAGTAVWAANAPTGCFTVEADPSNELSAIVKANPQANGDDADVGTVDLTVDGDAGEGVKELTAQAAVSVLPGDAETIALEEGSAEEQA